MTNYNIEAVGLQIASEVQVDGTGKAVFSIRAVERIVNVRQDTIASSLRSVNIPDGKTPSKLAQSLIDKGFEVTGFSKNGVPDIAAASIIEYYAFDAGARCTPEAMMAFRSFAAAGIRLWAHKITGWTPETKPDINPQLALRQYIESQLPEEPSKWVCRYPEVFWTELERLYGLKRGDKGCASIIHNYIYKKFPECVRDRLDEINPLNPDGERKNRQHQHFDEQLLSYLLMIIDRTIVAMQLSEDIPQFRKNVSKIPKLKLNTEIAQRLLKSQN